MTIDPRLLESIANPKMPQFDNPLEQYGKALQVVNSMNALSEGSRKEKSRNTLNSAAKYATKKGKLDQGLFNDYLAQNDEGSNILDTDKTFSEIGHINAQTGQVNAAADKTEIEAYGKELENNVKRWSGVSSDPKTGVRQAIALFEEEAKNPVLAKFLAKRKIEPQQAFDKAMGELEASVKSGTYPDLLRKLQLGNDKAMKQHYQLIEEEGKGQKLVAVPEMGGAPQVVGQYGAAPRKGTNVTVNTGDDASKAFSKRLSEHSADDFASLRNANQSALQSVPEVDFTLSLLDKGVTAGAWSNQITDARAIAKTLGIPVDENQLVNTQMLRQQLIGNVFNHVAQLKASGVSLTPMTDHDIALLKDFVAKGTDDVSTIRQSLLRYRASLQGINKRYREQARLYGESPVGPALEAVPTSPGGPIPDHPGTNNTGKVDPHTIELW